jgi:uncharacterized delta-60 repeat protein
LQPDGKILVASTSVNVLPDGGSAPDHWTSDLARLNADGSLDPSFNRVQGVNVAYGGIRVALQPDGKVILGGSFDSLNGVGRNRIARVNEDGSLDFSFNADIIGSATAPSGWVESIAVEPDAKVLIGGYFTIVNGVSRNWIARLNADGGLDTSFDPDNGVNAPVYSVALQSDGKVLISGGFTSVNGVRRNGIARLNADGALDTSFDPSNEVNGSVGSIALQSDGNVLISGCLTIVNGVCSKRFARLNANGALDLSFNPGNGPDDSVIMVLQTDGRLLIGGGFASVNGLARNYVARLFWGDPAVLVSGPVKDNSDFVAHFKGTPELAYTIESSASVSSAAWQKLNNWTAPTNDIGLGVGVFELRDLIAPSGQRFYRAVFPAY